MFKLFAFEFEDEVLLILCLLSYALNMIILVKDESSETRFFDWVLNLASTFIWTTVAYYTAISWLNIGFRMGLTIIVTMISPDLTKLVADRQFRKQIVEAIGNSVVNKFKSPSGENNNTNE